MNQPNAHKGLGGFFAWSAQARAFLKSSQSDVYPVSRMRWRLEPIRKLNVHDGLGIFSAWGTQAKALLPWR